MVEHGKEGRTNVDNAVNLVIHFAGDNPREKHDMVLALGPLWQTWHRLSSRAMETSGGKGQGKDPNLGCCASVSMCRPEFTDLKC